MNEALYENERVISWWISTQREKKVKKKKVSWVFFWYQVVHKRLIALVRKQNWNKDSSQAMMSCNKDPEDIGLTDWTWRCKKERRRVSLAVQLHLISATVLSFPSHVWVSFLRSSLSLWWYFSIFELVTILDDPSRNMHHQLSNPSFFIMFLCCFVVRLGSQIIVYRPYSSYPHSWQSNREFLLFLLLFPYDEYNKVNKHMSELHDGESPFCLRAFLSPCTALCIYFCWSAPFLFRC